MAPLFIETSEFIEDKINQNPNPNLKKNTESFKKTNFTPSFQKRLEELYPNQIITPNLIMGYLYAFLNNPQYQKKYYEMLRINFPRIIFPKEFPQFQQIAIIGINLIDLHTKEIDPQIIVDFFNTTPLFTFIFHDNGDNSLLPIRTIFAKELEFTLLEHQIWEYSIGSNQILRQWLNYRKKLVLNSDEIWELKQLIYRLYFTIKLRENIEFIKIEPN
jgi:hypothetical protein